MSDDAAADQANPDDGRGTPGGLPRETTPGPFVCAARRAAWAALDEEARVRVAMRPDSMLVADWTRAASFPGFLPTPRGDACHAVSAVGAVVLPCSGCGVRAWTGCRVGVAISRIRRWSSAPFSGECLIQILTAAGYPGIEQARAVLQPNRCAS